MFINNEQNSKLTPAKFLKWMAKSLNMKTVTKYTSSIRDLLLNHSWGKFSLTKFPPPLIDSTEPYL